MKDLIERLERASGPDYGLSQDIGKAVDARQRYEHPGSENPSWPHYTASLDAALTLVPEGWIWDVASSGAAWVMPDTDIEGQIVIGGIRSPAIALCIAALRARAAADGPQSDMEAGR